MPAKLGWTRYTPISKSLSDRTFDQEGICSCISPPDKLLLYERSAESEEGHSQDQAGISQQKGFLEGSNLSQLVLERKTCHGYREVIEASIIDTHPKGFVRLLVKMDGSPYRWLGWSDKLVGINQLNRIVVDLNVLGQFGSQVRRKHVSEVEILDGNLCRSLGKSWTMHRNWLTQRELCRSHVPGQALQLQLFFT